MDVNKYIDDCLILHKEAGKDTYCIIPRLNKNIGYTVIDYIFCNLHLNNEFIAKNFLFNLVNYNLEPGPIFKEDIKVVLS